jgi:hypothetical protein
MISPSGGQPGLQPPAALGLATLRVYLVFSVTIHY